MNHLYAANFNELDDPMEGVFESDSPQNSGILTNIKNNKTNTHICSLSPTYQSMLMWSFYADYHKGCCVEMEISDEKIKKVDYVEKPIDLCFTNNMDEKEKIEKILLRKYKDWAFEKELRVLDEERYIKVEVKKVYFGMRIPDDLYDKLKTQIEGLKKVIKVDKMSEDMFKHIDTSDTNSDKQV